MTLETIPEILGRCNEMEKEMLGTDDAQNTVTIVLRGLHNT